MRQYNNDPIPLNLHPAISNRLMELNIITSISADKNNVDILYRYFQFPNGNLDISSIKAEAKQHGIFINAFENGDIRVSWFANDTAKYATIEMVELFNEIIDLIPAPMSWVKLISPIKSKKQTIDREYIRGVFDHDNARIVSSSAFRKLQNKTQVIPLSENDTVHNRLTHSIEVASVGKKIARMIADSIWESYIYPEDLDQIVEIFRCANYSDGKEVFINNIADIVSAACLIHDIGNPPFGHQGEEALKETYEELLEHPNYIDTLGKLKNLQADLFKIEGNAQTIRLLAKNKNIDLTYATLAASIKYPRIYSDDSSSIYKKFNIYQSELELFNNILSSCGLSIASGNDYERHPLVYIVEAADDICYGLFDFEDFVHLGFITQETYCNTLIEIILPNLKAPTAKKIKGETIEEKRTNYKQNMSDEKLSFGNITSKLRSEAMHQMILNAVHAFKEKYEYIIRGAYTQQNKLLNASGKINSLLNIYEDMIASHSYKDSFKQSNKDLKNHSINFGYNNLYVLKNSLGGYEVMSELLKTYIAAIHNLKKLKSQMVLYTIPEDYLLPEIINSLKTKSSSSWTEVLSETQQIEQIRLLNDYLTGLTDTAALKLFRHIKGHEQITLV